MVITMEKADVTLIGWNIVCLRAPGGGYGEIFVGYSVGDG